MQFSNDMVSSFKCCFQWLAVNQRLVFNHHMHYGFGLWEFRTSKFIHFDKRIFISILSSSFPCLRKALAIIDLWKSKRCVNGFRLKLWNIKYGTLTTIHWCIDRTTNFLSKKTFATRSKSMNFIQKRWIKMKNMKFSKISFQCILSSLTLSVYLLALELNLSFDLFFFFIVNESAFVYKIV